MHTVVKMSQRCTDFCWKTASSFQPYVCLCVCDRLLCVCLSVCVSQGARSIVNFELMPRPPTERSSDNPWPTWPVIFRVDYGHAEVQLKFGNDPRVYNVMSKVLKTSVAVWLIGTGLGPIQALGCNLPLILLLISALCTSFACLLTLFLFFLTYLLPNFLFVW